jgi:hypothetical protein
MKKIINLIFKIHIKLFKIPCRAHVRLAVENSYAYNSSWRIGMLYVCGENPAAIAEWMCTDKKEVIQILNEVTRGIKYE